MESLKVLFYAESKVSTNREDVNQQALNRVPGGADKVAQDGDIRPIGTDTPSIHGQAENFCKIKINAGIIEFRQTETLRGQNAIHPRWIDRPGRAVTPPWAKRQLIELLPIAFVPSGHAYSIRRMSRYFGCTILEEGS